MTPMVMMMMMMMMKFGARLLWWDIHINNLELVSQSADTAVDHLLDRLRTVERCLLFILIE